ncbi:hypothetical protein [Peribacillus frigoritolerans]|uniref:hypothetical protein n=1 Tax=Peribacillus frigoritolerans TaxID=450367 RepID=UPI003B8B0910
MITLLISTIPECVGQFTAATISPLISLTAETEVSYNQNFLHKNMHKLLNFPKEIPLPTILRE